MTLKIKKIIFVLACMFVASGYFFAAPTKADEVTTRLKDSNNLLDAPQRRRGRGSFDHASKKHRTLNCNGCHRVSVAQPNVRSFPGHIACIGCHNLAAETMMGFDNYCGICHAGKPVSRGIPKMFDFVSRTRQLASDFGIDFSHVEHRKALPQDVSFIKSPESKFNIGLSGAPRCSDCHSRTEPRPATAPEMNIEKGHSTCFQCHGERPAAARKDFPYMNDCGACHDLAGGKSPMHYNKLRAFHHEDHESYNDTRPVRKAEYRTKAADYLCAECHASVDRAANLRDIRFPEERTCNACHNGKLGLPDALETNVVQQLRNAAR